VVKAFRQEGLKFPHRICGGVHDGETVWTELAHGPDVSRTHVENEGAPIRIGIEGAGDELSVGLEQDKVAKFLSSRDNQAVVRGYVERKDLVCFEVCQLLGGAAIERR
jgi:hypothetical protein